MAMPGCPRCQNRILQLMEFTPAGSRFTYNAVMCSSCGTVVGVVDYSNIGQMIRKQNAALKEIGEKLGLYFELET